MHDIDRAAYETVLHVGENGREFGEYEGGFGEYEAGFGEYEAGFGEYEADGREYEAGGTAASRSGNPNGAARAGPSMGMPPLDEATEVELTSELLETQSSGELDRFLGDVFGRAASAVGRAAGAFVRSDAGQALGGMVRDVARQSLPVLGRAAGQWLGGSTGGDIGADVASAAGDFFGLELEGLSEQEAEFESYRAFVRFVWAAALLAASSPKDHPPSTIARRAIAEAAGRYAPGLLPWFQDGGRPRATGLARGRRADGGTEGRWQRRGRSIVLLDVD
jgi:hypothetical protein